jgi:ZIP family zinc transporter
VKRYALAALPLLLLGALLAVIVWSGPADSLRGENVPPVERLTFQRVTLAPDSIVVNVMNDGPDRVSIAQVQVDDAFWTFTADDGTVLDHLGRTTLTIPYPWVQGEAHVVRVLTSPAPRSNTRFPSPSKRRGPARGSSGCSR